jgi:TolB-like protein
MASGQVSSPNPIQFGDNFELDARACELRRAGRPLKLERIPMELLLLLIEQRGRVVTRKEILEKIWGKDVFVDPESSINSAVRKIRQVLEDDPTQPRFLQTVSRRGYRFIASIWEVGFPEARRCQDGRPKSSESPAVKKPTNQRIRSIAVLPLENLTGDAGQQYFADGMTEALITTLAQIESLGVISRTSALHYHASGKPLPQIANELRVDGIVEGSVARCGNRVRIDAQLIHAPSDRHLWAKSYERDLQDVLALQGEIARSIASEIKIRLTPKDRARLRNSPPVNREAYDAYLKGRFFWNKRTAQALKTGIGHFEDATKKDPGYARAYAGLADSYDVAPFYSVMTPKEAYPRAKAAAMKALEIDESLGDAHTSLAHALWSYDWDWASAERENQRSLELNSNYATGHHWYSWFLELMGRHDEAVHEAQRALRLDPLSLAINTQLGVAYYYAREYRHAVEQLRKTLELDPRYPMAYIYLGQCLDQLEEFEGAIAEFEKGLQAVEDPWLSASLIHACGRADRRMEAKKELAKLLESSKTKVVSPYLLAMAYAGLDEKAKALGWLETAYRERANWIPYLKVDPEVDNLRTDPRFAELLRRVGLPC